MICTQIASERTEVIRHYVVTRTTAPSRSLQHLQACFPVSGFHWIPVIFIWHSHNSWVIKAYLLLYGSCGPLVPFCDGGAFGSFRTPDDDWGVNVEVFCGSLGGSSALVEGGALGSTLDGLEDAILAGTVRTIASVLILAADTNRD